MNLEDNDHQYEERKTPGGYLVKVRLSKMTYVVFTPKGPEVPKGAKNNSIIVPVPRVVFLGEDFNLSHFRLGDLSFVNVKSGKLVIPYQHGASREIKTIFLNTGSTSDILPVIVHHYNTPKEVAQLSEQNLDFHHIVADEGLQRNDMVSLKIRYPTVNILLLKKKMTTMQDPKTALPADEKGTEKPIDDNANATLRASGGNLNMQSDNPVFLSRIHLRNMELDKVKQLLFDFDLSGEDVVFIRTFLDVMIRNVNNKEELAANQDKLKTLDEIFRLSEMIIRHNETDFEIELEKGLTKEVAYMVYALLEKYQENASNIEEEIMFWEWKYRARRLM
ncbi:MAG: hypothetical protein H7A24_04245 [Leptospiraceae bacterium]|nr:hypothetical protein [Leptospiraceae bacterium]MCP5511065.1 hypothetical protein [Leptospiraceae bacterium]